MGNLQVRFLEGWAPAMAPGYSTLTGSRQGCPSLGRNQFQGPNDLPPSVNETGGPLEKIHFYTVPIARHHVEAGRNPCLSAQFVDWHLPCP
jgi:hypothetical protein